MPEGSSIEGNRGGKWKNFRAKIGGNTEAPKPQEPLAEFTGVPTDPKLVQFFFKQKGEDVHPIATDTFLDKSRTEYNGAWLTRELVQNFVDHNPEHPGTLDGVNFSIEDLPTGEKRFRIEGNWPFEDPTGVMTPHSEKPDDMKSAGGNGIGLKQTAIRLLRDFGVKKFEIDGEGWAIDYKMVTADSINDEWSRMQRQTPLHKVKHDWLLAYVREAHNTGKNAYVIETDNPDLIKSLSQLPTLGVSQENPYLQNMDYQNQYGAIKWLPGEDAEGRLFINGQVMNFKSKGTTAEDYWVGPESVTIQLNNVDYRMSIDRPPVTTFDLRHYLDNLVGGMSKEDVINQLKNAETIWAGHTDSSYGSDRKGAFVVIEKLVGTLPWKGYDKKEWQESFGNKKYIAWDKSVNESQIRELEKQGYIVCPGYFEPLGMDAASSKLSSIEAASNEKPRVPQHQREKFAQDYGIEVASEEFPNVKSTEQFIQLIGKRLAEHIEIVEENDDNPNTVRIRLKTGIPKELLFHALPKPKGEDQKLVYLLRGMAAYGLEKNLFQKIFTSQGEFVTTFGLDYDTVTSTNVLLGRNIPNKSNKGAFVEIELADQYMQQFKDALHRERRPIENGRDAVPLGTQGKIAGLEGKITPQEDLRDETKIDLRAVNEGAWTPEQEELYKIASEKNPKDLTDEDRRIIGQRMELKRSFGNVPVLQPDIPEKERQPNIVQRKATISDAETERVAKMEEGLPGIVEVVDKLEKLVPETKPEALSGQTAVEKYLSWRDSEHFYGQLGETSGYLTGKHLIELVYEQDQADISSVKIVKDKTPEDSIRGILKDRLDAIVKRMNSAEDDVDDFDIVTDPTEKQLAQLGLLRLYAQLTTGVALPNDLFVYKGTGSKGVNLGQKAIGMHESLFDVNFTEAIRTFIHEIAHNYPEAADHGNMFRHAMESLFVTAIDRTSQIANKLLSGEEITQEERVILDMRKEWDKIKAT